MNSCNILYVDDDKAILKMVERYLSREGYAVQSIDSGRKALDLLKKKHFDIVFTDFKMPEFDGIELLSAIKEYRPETEVVIVTGHGTMETAIKAMKIGSYDYLQKPFKLELLKLIVDRIADGKRLKDERALLKTRVKERHRYDALVGISLRMQEIYESIDRMKSSSPNVLISGESGSGKELAARVIQRNSDRSRQPLIPITCQTLLKDLAGEEVTYHLSQLLDSSDGGTLYLDEITDISPPIQGEFVRALKKATTPASEVENRRKHNIRLIGATCKDLKNAIEGEMIRRDFFNLINTVTIRMPPLRDRKEDVCLLINHFLHTYNSKHTRKVFMVAPEALSYLLRYHWPGNVIQLENVIERAFALGVDAVIEISDLPAEIKTFGDISRMG
jgi:DNA-binding NtrC family response regulator